MVSVRLSAVVLAWVLLLLSGEAHSSPFRWWLLLLLLLLSFLCVVATVGTLVCEHCRRAPKLSMLCALSLARRIVSAPMINVHLRVSLPLPLTEICNSKILPHPPFLSRSLHPHYIHCCYTEFITTPLAQYSHPTRKSRTSYHILLEKLSLLQLTNIC